MPSILDISVVIPVYNNSGSLRELTARLVEVLAGCSNNYEIIFVNDGSRDSSLSLLKTLAAETSTVRVINLSRNFGQHPAICAGFEHCSGEICILMDADLQDRPENIVDLVQKLHSEEADIAYSIKQSSDKKLTSRLTSMLYHYVFGYIVKTKVPLNIGTFRAFNRKFLDAMLKFREVNILYGPLMFFIGFKSCFVELPYQERSQGKSSYTFRKRLQLAINSLISYTEVPYKLSMLFGVTLMFGSMVYGFIVTLQFLLHGSNLPSGTTLILLVLCLTLGGIMTILGVIGTYLFRVYQEVLHRPRYLVEEMINFP